jgi:dephospho-CoA kinase
MPNRSKNLSIGVTGGIGAGKTLICSIFSNLGIPVYHSDDRAKFLMNHKKELKDDIRRTFGKEAFYQDGSLNRNYMAAHVFDDKTNLEKLNRMVHPAVQDDYRHWILKQSDTPYTLKEAALLFETGSYKDLDHTILVYAPLSVRINRILMRDPNRSRTDIEKIIQHQMDEEDKKKLADDIIYNDDSRLVIPQVLELHRQFTGEKS